MAVSTNNTESTGRISKLESFGLVDGPGVRFVVFMQGCRMRCRYCHNPESWNMDAGTPYTARQVFDKAIRYRSYWRDNGGITVSGGEPLLQIDFVTELFRLCHEKGVHTTLDTSGNPFSNDPSFMKKFEDLMQVTDLIMLDLKEIRPDAHKSLTGQPLDNILEMARWLSDHGKHMWIRHVLVPNLTDDKDSLIQLDEFIRSLNGVDKVEILPYHSMGVYKWHNLEIPYSLEDTDSPTEQEIRQAEKLLHIESEAS